MDTGRMIVTTLLTGIALGILLTPEKGKKVRGKLYKGRNDFNGKLKKELKKFDKAIKKQMKTARKEISDLVENQYDMLSNPESE